ncbi:maleylpyruvate isomerase family mycothiol-dependent enzyme [Streptomyces sp. URMC 123]|uniref:maleylpyruvate isomerase family mycothiol-dependent enzyme n=1 Tax=Streptomyces sp. URMC 123 TaxID=3423403 RepID=UPI003F1A51BE
MTNYAHDVALVQQATERLITAVEKLDDAGLAAPSRLPGWTRGHVLAHVARNADALVNVLTAARTGTPVPMYRSAEAREADIEEGAGRPLPAQLDDLRASAARFAETAAALTEEQRARRVELRNGVTDTASRVPFRRLIEVELHHVDLGVGYVVEDLPDEFTDRELEYVAGERFAGRLDVPALLLSTDDGRHWRTGRSSEEPVEVSGTPAALMGWLTGRSDGSDLDPGDSVLPALPPLG